MSAKPERKALIERSAANSPTANVDGQRIVKPTDPDYDTVYTKAVEMHGYGYPMPYADESSPPPKG